MVATWVLLRGLGRGAGHWGEFPAQFRATLGEAPETRLALPELPGNGLRHHERSPTRVRALVEDLRAELRRQGLRPPYHLLALSLGAMVAVDWAHHHPGELAAAVLVNTSLRPFSAPYRRLRPGAALRLLTLPLRSPASRERSVLALTSRQVSDPDATLARWLSLHRAQPVSAANGLRQLLAAARYRAPARAPAVPMLLLSSQRDALVHPACSAALARRWQLPLASHPLAGHDLPLDDGAWVARQVVDWLAGHP